MSAGNGPAPEIGMTGGVTGADRETGGIGAGPEKGEIGTGLGIGMVGGIERGAEVGTDLTDGVWFSSHFSTYSSNVSVC